MPLITNKQGAFLKAGTTQGCLLRAGSLVWSAPAATAPALRTASTGTSQHIHDGHSLTDAYAASGRLDQFHQAITGVAAGYLITHPKSTVPGASTLTRWNHYTAAGTPMVNPRWDMGLFDTLMQVERGLTTTSVAMPYTDPGVFKDDLLYELKFLSNAIQNARSTPVDYILWGIWPGTDMVDWEDILEDEHYRHKLRADWLTWKAHQLHPSLPADWRVWLFPGYEVVKRLIADLATGGIWPGVETTYSEFLTDAIHPDTKLMFGLECLVATALYQADLRTMRPAIRSIASGFMTSAEADYFIDLAWSIASTYEPCGMGGTQGADAAWTLADNGDYFPTVTDTATLATALPENGQIPAVWNGRDGAVPADALIVVSADGVTGGTFDTPLPAATDGYIEMLPDQFYTISGLSLPDGVWQAALVHVVNPPTNVYAYSGGVISNYSDTTYSSPGASVAPWTAGGMGGMACNLSVGFYNPGEDNVATTKIPFVDPRRYENADQSNIPVGFWLDTTGRGVRHPDGTLVSSAHGGTYPVSGDGSPQRLKLGLNLDPDTAPRLRIWGWIVMDREPTETEWGDMFDWLSAKALKP